MSGAAFLRLKKLTGSGIVGKAARHNRRVIQAELGASGPIDATRSHLNITLMGPSTADEVAQLAKAKIMEVGITKARKNAVMGVELVFSLPSGHTQDVSIYFSACAKWAGAEFGGVDNIVSVDIHRDEAQDHAHVLLVPLFEGRLRGSDAVGNKKKLTELQAKFFKEVASGFGFSKPRARLTGNNKAQATRQVLDRLHQDPAGKSEAWAVIRDNVERDPMPWAQALGISIAEAPNKPAKTMAQIFTSKGKGRQTENPIGFQPAKPYRVSGPQKAQTLGLCRESISSPPSKAPKEPAHQSIEGASLHNGSTVVTVGARQSTERVSLNAKQVTPKASTAPVPEDTSHDDNIIRVRDSEFDATSYDPDTGEFHTPTVARTSARAKADQWVRQALQGRADKGAFAGFD